MIEGSRIRLKTWQQAAVAMGSAVGALLDPRRADLIAALGETTGKPAFEKVLQRMKSSPEGRVSWFILFYSYFFLVNVDILLAHVVLDVDLFNLLFIGCSMASTSNNNSLFILGITKSSGSGDGWPLVLVIDKSDYKQL